MAGMYRPRHPERTVLYRVLFHYFDRFLIEYESRFEKQYGFFRPIIREVVERYLDCGNPRCGFARIRCPDCGEERLLMFSCRTRGYAVHSILEDFVLPATQSALKSGASG
ncbi:MAG: transposase zinc-binding domain-containing protein [Candidatus Aminicenantales bacterium]